MVFLNVVIKIVFDEYGIKAKVSEFTDNFYF